jgi:putative peptidoglycan lipid II flippase
MLAISLGVAIFPLLSRYAARDDGLGLRETINRALRLSIFEGLAAGTGLFVLARPITHLIFVRGDFQPADAAASAQILQTYAVGMWAYCSYQIVSRSFFALKRPRTPLISSCVLVVVNLLMVISLIWLPSIRAAAFGVATATTASANVLILGWLLRRRIGPIGGRRILRSIVRSIIASALMAGAIGLLRWQLEQTGVAIWIIVAVCVPVGAGVFFASAWLLRCEELHELGRRPASDEEPPAEKPV